MSGVNPVYTLADAASFTEGLKKVTTSVVMSLKKMRLRYYDCSSCPSLFRGLGVTLTKGILQFNTTYDSSLFDTKQLQDVLMSLNGLTVLIMII
jgi:molybdopterin-containing oxidoreductase family iron-sulfur binding subunit